MMKKLGILLAVLLMVFAFGCKQASERGQPSELNVPPVDEVDETMNEQEQVQDKQEDSDNQELVLKTEVRGELKNGKVNFAVYGENFRFYVDELENPALIVKEGDIVKIKMKSNEQNIKHNFVLDEFGVASNQVSGAAVTGVEFIAEQKGTFRYYCSVENHRAAGMEGNFIVE